MPIKKDGIIEYKIPNEYKKMISKEFLAYFYEKLREIFHRSIYDLDKVTYANFIIHIESTHGWWTAFDDACNKFNFKTLKEYSDTLTWYDGDLFCSEIGDMLIKEGIVEEGVYE